MEQEVKTIDAYVSEVADRMGNLSKEEAMALSKLYGSQELMIIGKVLGPDVSGILGDAMNQIAAATAVPQKPAGLGSR